uniref:Probable threonine--tRNA ligase, cytoplasmic n=1 Tax=Arcella intermedia TaxID=1963864 RepID=A0A6B2KYY4_9EUKA
MWDLTRPIEQSCRLELFKFDSAEGKKVFWHSSAHIMGQALEKIFSCELCIGPPLDNGGFYYDMALPGLQGAFEQEHYDLVQEVVDKISKEKQPFERLVLTKDEALEMFGNNKYKRELISEKVPDGDTCTAYRCGPLIDLCKGPHLPHTGKIKAFQVWKNAAAYWKGNSENDSLQRVYGMSFPDTKQYTEWKKEMQAALERDHRLQGTKQELFFFHQWAPGCPFFLPRGAKLYNKLVEFIKGEYRKRGFTEVISPNMFNSELWKVSGHWEHYKDGMFLFDVEEQEFALKPMNCPGHCLMFKNKGKRPYKELPLRFADFGVLHRNELSGALTGLTRVRRFCQDDAHIFCREDQIASEIAGCFDFLKHVYNETFGWYFTLELSTRPEKKFIGDLEVWNRAEATLAECLDSFVGQGKWKVNPGDGAFYGPKIDIHVFDALKREHQCATIQLDFNLPKNFDLSYINEAGAECRPVMIHRAVLGSIERFMAILVENTAGKWPFWLSPRPAILCSIHQDQNAYAEEVAAQLNGLGFEVDLDLSDHKVQKKVAVAQAAHYNYILVVGAQEASSNSVNIRLNNEQRVSSIDDLIKEWKELLENHK